MTITTTTIKNSYSGNGSNTVFAYTYKILAEGDIEVIVRSANGTETVKTLTTDYTVSGVGSASGGNVTFVTAPLSTETVVLRRETTQTQSVDLVENDPFTAETVEGAFDRAIVIAQELQEEVDRSIKISRTNTMTSTEFTVGSAERANKILAFDSNGEIAVTQELGTYQGNWSASTSYSARDLVKDTSNNNIYLCNTSHTSSGSQPLSSNTDSAKWDLIVDAASATSSATAAASSATAAASSATAAATSATNAATSESNASTSETNASTSATSASTSATAAATSESNAATSETNAASSATAAASSATAAASSATAAASSATAAASSETNAATSESNASTSETNAASSASSASTSATNAATSATSASTSATNAATSETNAATSATSAATSATNAAASYDSFDDRYLGPKATAPAVDNDGDALLTGALYFDTTSNAMKVYGSSGWQNAGSSINGTSDRFQYSFSSSTTTVTGTDSNGNTLVYDPPYVDVYLNGIKMVNGTDVTVTSGTSVVFASPIGTSGTDYVDIVAYGTFNVATIAASAITSGTLGYARGGTGLGTLGSADEVLQVNAGGTALEYGKVDTANIADNAVGATQLDVATNGTAGQVLASDGDGTFSWADAPSAFSYNAPTGTSQTWDIGSYNYFNMGQLSGNTTVAFSNVPTEASWEFKVRGGEATNSWDLTKSGKEHTFNPYTEAINNSQSPSTTNNHGGLSFKSDGTEMYVLFEDALYQFTLATAWRLDSATYTRKFDYPSVTNFDPSTTYGTGLFFKDDGTKMYILGTGLVSSNRKGGVDEYSLSTAWDISTAGTPTFKDLDTLASRTNSNPKGMFIGNSGTKLYVWHNGTTGTEGLWEFTLSTAWNTSTASYVRNVDTSSSGLNVVTTSNGRDIAFKSDGTQIYFLVYVSSALGKVVIGDLSTAWDTSTITISSKGNKTYGTGFYVTSDKFFSHQGSTSNVVSINNATAYTLTLPTSVNIDGLSNPDNVLSPVLDTEYLYKCVTSDGGTNVTRINVGSANLF